MPTIGKTTDGDRNSQIFIRSFGTINPIYFYTAVAGDVATEFHWRGKTNGSGDVTISCGVYTVTAGLPDVQVGATKTLLVTSATSQQWDSGAVSIPLTAGVQYCVAWSPDVAYEGRRIAEAVNGTSTDLTLPIPPVWNQFNQITVTWTMWADVTNTPPPSSDILFPCCAQLV